MERSAPVILLIEDDEFDRMTLTHMLEESGCSVMASRRGKSAVDTFAIYHRGIALVLASSGLSDVERIRLVEALYRIAPYVPIVIAARRASHRPNSGEDSGRAALFSALIAEVQRRLQEVSARAAAQAQSFARVQPPAPTSTSAASPTSARGSRVRRSAYASYTSAASTARAYHPDDMLLPDQEVGFFPDAAPFAWTGSSSHLTPIANLDPRSYLRRQSNARRVRRRRIRRIGFAIAAGCIAPWIVSPLLQLRTTTARAISQDALPPLASASVSARMGIVPLVPATRVSRSSVAAELRSRIEQAQPNSERKRRTDRR